MKRACCSLFIAAALAISASGGTTAASTSKVVSAEPAATSAQQVLKGTYPWGIALGIDRQGKRHVVAGRKNGDLWYATDRTGTWTSKRILTGSKDDWVWGKPSIALDGQGRVHIAVVKDFPYDVPGGTHGIWYLTDKGRTRGDFGRRVRISPNYTTDPSLRVVGNVRYLAYATYPIPGDPTWPVYFKTDRSGSWKRERVASRGFDPALRVDAYGRSQIVFGTSKGVRYTRARSKTGDFTKPTFISRGKDPSGAPSLVAGQNGRPQVVWPSSVGGNRIWYTKRTSSGWRTPVRLGTGQAAAISIDSRSRPHVVIGSRQVVHAWRTPGGWRRNVLASGADNGGAPVADVDIRGYGKRASVVWAPGSTGGGVWVARD